MVFSKQKESSCPWQSLSAHCATVFSPQVVISFRGVPNFNAAALRHTRGEIRFNQLSVMWVEGKMPTKESMIYGGSFYQGENWLHPGLFEALDVKSSRLENGDWESGSDGHWSRVTNKVDGVAVKFS
jgi:hypothetical protein